MFTYFTGSLGLSSLNIFLLLFLLLYNYRIAKREQINLT